MTHWWAPPQIAITTKVHSAFFALLYTFGLTGMLNGPSQHGFNYLVTKNQRRLFRTDGQVKLQFNIFARWWWGTRSGLKHNLIYIYKSCSVPNTERGYNSTYSTIIETVFSEIWMGHVKGAFHHKSSAPCCVKWKGRTNFRVVPNSQFSHQFFKYHFLHVGLTPSI